MKKHIIYTVFSLVSLLGVSQKIEKAGIIKKDQKGKIYAVEFPLSTDKSKIPKTASSFFEHYLEKSTNDHFEKVAHKSKKAGFIHEHYDQYYQGVKVEGGGYNFHYKKGDMYFANGNYVNITNLKPIPSISLEDAKNAFLEYKDIEAKAVVDYITKLIIKEINSKDGQAIGVNLVYSIYLQSDHPNDNEIGYVDAHSGKVLMTEAKLTDLLGTFATRYSGSQQAQTDPVTGGHRLLDNTRGATIHTQSLQNNTTFIVNAVEITDNDNDWTAAEHTGNNNDMGLDVHWALQEIYDYFDNEHQINSFDDADEPINAYVRFGENIDNAFWNPTLNVLLFAQGNIVFRPLASLDVVGHEYGHGITDFQIGWSNTGNQGAFGEGMSDIWGAILESRISPSNTWRIGEQLTLNNPYLRNLENTNDTNAITQMADTFEDSQYNSSSDIRNRGGVLSHWFYLLVNGGSGTNGVGNSYSVDGISMELAEDILVEAVFNNYLDNTTTYPAIRTAMINAATAVSDDCNSDNYLIARAVTNAWHAVGVGAKYVEPSVQTIVLGPSTVCTTNSTFTLQNAPANTTVSWTKSPNIAYVSGQGTSSYVVKAASPFISGTGWVEATITGACGSITLPRDTVWVSSAPSQPTITVPLEPVNCQYEALAWATSTPDDVVYQWDIDNGVIVSYDNAEITFQTDCPPRTLSNWLLLEVMASNICGTTSYTTDRFDVENGGPLNPLSVAPNPVDDILNVNLKEIFKGKKRNTAKVYLYNNSNRVVFKTKTSNANLRIPTGEMQEGNYVLKVEVSSSKAFTKHVVIKH